MRNPEFKKRNLCDTCAKVFPDCLNLRNHKVSFGTGKGNDNIYVCNKYKENKPAISVDQLKRQLAIAHPRYKHVAY